MILLRLLSLVSLSHGKLEKAKLALTLFGVAIGIAIFYAIRSANDAAMQSFADSASMLHPENDLELYSPTGAISEDVVTRLLALKEVRGVYPQSSYFAEASSDGKKLGMIQMLGVDLFRPGKHPYSDKFKESSALDLLRNPRAVLISPALRDELNDGKLELVINSRPREFDVLDTLPDQALARAYGGKVVLLDISHFQDALENYGRVDSISIGSEPGVPAEKLRTVIQAVLPPEIEFREQNAEAKHAEKMSEAFRLNLNFLACISLFVAVLLIYNTMSFSVLKRRSELSILRSLGASGNTLFLMIAAESLLLGFAASLLGLALGMLLARVTVQLVSVSFTALYAPVAVKDLQLRRDLAIQCLLLGPALALAAGLLPAWQVKTQAPRDTLYYQQYEQKFAQTTFRLAAAALVFFILTLLSAQPSFLNFSLYAGFAAPAFLIFGTMCVIPLFIRLFIRLVKLLLVPLLGIEVSLAIDHLRTTLRRSSVAVAAMAIAMGLFVGISMMILSFRLTVRDWIEHVTKADIYVSAVHSLGTGSNNYLPQPVVDFLGAYPAVADIDWVVTRRLSFGGREIRVNGIRFEMLKNRDRYLFQHKFSPEELRAALDDPESAFVSETFSQRSGLKTGDQVTIPGLDSTRVFKIRGVFYDYSSDQGVILIDSKVFETLFDETRKEGVSLYLRDAGAEPALRTAIEQQFPDVRLVVRSNQNLRQEVLRVFDQTFKVTYALQAIALLIAGLTVLNTILMLMLERKREFAVMRAIGASTRSLTKMVVVESFLLCAAAASVALFLGFGLALILVFVVNKFFFGWSIFFTVPYGLLFETVLAALVLSLLAGYFPGRRVARQFDGSQLRYE